MRMSAAELVAHHRAHIGVDGHAVRVVFSDPTVARAFADEVLREATEIPRGATRLVRTIELKEGPEPHRFVLDLVDGDDRTHRFFVSREELIRAIVAVSIAPAPMMVGISRSPSESDAAPESTADAERNDDLLEIGLIHTRLGRAEVAIRLQRRRMNAMRADFAQRFGRFPSYCCQRCGDQIGWIGRAFQAVGLPLHTCRVERDEA